MAESEHRRTRNTSLERYVTSVSVCALVVMFWVARASGSPRVGDRWPGLCLFVVLLCACEIKPITVARVSGVKETVASTTFAFAIFLSYGPVLAMCAQAAASLLGDLCAKKSGLKLIFNVGQYWIAWGLAAIGFAGVAGSRTLFDDGASWRWNLGVLTAGVLFFVANNSLVGAAIALSSASSMKRVVRRTIVQEATSDCVLLAWAPIVIIVADRSLVFLPLLLLPVFAVYKSASISVEKEHQALHDVLTGLPNRLSFVDALQRRIVQPKLAYQQAAVLLIDLDRFKEVNDTLGHHAGDVLLALIGPRLRPVLPELSIIARLGGDEFAILLPTVQHQVDAISIAAEIGRALEAPFPIDDFQLEVEASIGVALFPDHGRTTDELIKHADIAMYVAKSRHSVTELYDPSQDHHSTKRLRLVGELRRAISDGEITLYYQPKLDLHSGAVCGVEALVRWIHPQHGLVLPSEFVPVAEHTGLIRPLTRHVLATAVQQAAIWRQSGHELAVAINLSARSLHDGGIVHDVSEDLTRYELPGRLLQIEITESSIMADPARARRILDQLHEMGVNLSIDDFGTGYSSLAYLQELPVNEIKIDRSFVTNVVDSPADQVIVKSTIDLAKNLGLTSTAEGIESAPALSWLRSAGCDQAQGFHIARPMPAHELGEWISEARARDSTQTLKLVSHGKHA